MRKRMAFYTVISSIVLVALIWEAPRASAAASDGIRLCIVSLIPSLFPFLFITTLLNGCLVSANNRIIRFLGRICGIPSGAEAVLLLGLLGGYPAGAQCIGRYYNQGLLNKSDAARLLGFCNNAGPAFIFGVGSCLFANKTALFVLWGLQILSSVAVGHITRAECAPSLLAPHTTQSIHSALFHSVKAMGSICGWVIIFRIIMSYLEFLPAKLYSMLVGILELSNGVYLLQNVENTGARFVTAALILSWGGLCVLMQTAGLTEDLGITDYLRGKLLQVSLIFPMAYLAQLVLFSPSEQFRAPLFLIFLSVVPLVIISKNKIVLAFRKKLVYNGAKVQNTE